MVLPLVETVVSQNKDVEVVLLNHLLALVGGTGVPADSGWVRTIESGLVFIYQNPQ